MEGEPTAVPGEWSQGLITHVVQCLRFISHLNFSFQWLDLVLTLLARQKGTLSSYLVLRLVFQPSNRSAGSSLDPLQCSNIPLELRTHPSNGCTDAK